MRILCHSFLVFFLSFSFAKAEEGALPLTCGENFTPQNELDSLKNHTLELRRLISPLLANELLENKDFENAAFRREMAELKLADYEEMHGISISDPAKREELIEQFSNEFMIEMGPLGKSKIFYWALMKSLRDLKIDSFEDYQVFRKAFFAQSFPEKNRLELVVQIFERINEAINHSSEEDILNFARWSQLAEMWGIETEEVPLLLNEWAVHSQDHQLYLKKMILTALALIDKVNFQRVLQERVKDDALLTEERMMALLTPNKKKISSNKASVDSKSFGAIPLSEETILHLALNKVSLIPEAEFKKVKNQVRAGVALIIAIDRPMTFTGNLVSILIPIGIPKIGINYLRSKVNLDFSSFFNSLESSFRYMNRDQLIKADKLLSSIYEKVVKQDDSLTKVYPWIKTGEPEELIPKNEFSPIFVERIKRLSAEIKQREENYSSIDFVARRYESNLLYYGFLKDIRQSNIFNSLTNRKAIELIIPLMAKYSPDRLKNNSSYGDTSLEYSVNNILILGYRKNPDGRVDDSFYMYFDRTMEYIANKNRLDNENILEKLRNVCLLDMGIIP